MPSVLTSKSMHEPYGQVYAPTVNQTCMAAGSLGSTSKLSRSTTTILEAFFKHHWFLKHHCMSSQTPPHGNYAS